MERLAVAAVYDRRSAAQGSLSNLAGSPGGLPDKPAFKDDREILGLVIPSKRTG